MAAVDELIGTLRAEGKLDSHGEFSLDRDKARDKLRRYQLATPQAWLTELVQAAVLMGAGRIEIESDADDTRIVFDGGTFTAEDLHELYSAVFSSEEGQRVEARRQLALGFNGAMALEPRWLRLTSAVHGDQDMVFAEMRPAVADHVEQRPATRSGTTIHVRKRFRPATVIEFFKNLGSGTSEEDWVRDRCRFCHVPVFIEGTQVSSGPVLEEVAVRVPIAGDGIVGEGGFDAATSAVSRLHVLSNGVLVTSEVLDLGALPFLAVAESRALKKNVAQSGIVKDAAWDGLVHAVLAAREAAMCELCRGFMAAQSVRGLSSGRILGALRQEVLGFISFEPFDGADRGTYPGILAAVKIWRTAAESDTLLSLDDLLAIADEVGEVHYCSRSFRGFKLEGDLERIALLASRKERNGFELLFAGRLKNVTRRLSNQIKREQNRKLWLARSHDAVLGPGRFLARARVQNEAVRGEIGVRSLGLAATSFRFVKDGHLLHREEKEMPVPGCEVVLEADFHPSKNYDGVWKDAALAGALLAVVRTLPVLFEELAREGLKRRSRRDELATTTLDFLGFAVGEDNATRYLEAYGISASTAARHVASASVQRAFATVDLGSQSRSPLVDVPCFSTLGGHAVSLAAIHRHLQRNPGLSFVAAEHGEVDDPGELVLRLGAVERLVVEAVFGGEALVDAGERLRQAAARKALLDRPREPRRVHGPVRSTAAVLGSLLSPLKLKKRLDKPRQREEPQATSRASDDQRPVEPASDSGPVETSDSVRAPVARRRPRRSHRPSTAPRPRAESTPDLPGETLTRRVRGLLSKREEIEEKKAEAPPPGAEDRLVEAVRALIRALPADELEAVGGLDLERLSCGAGRSSPIASVGALGPRLHRRNEVVESVLRTFESDPVGVIFLASALMTAANRQSEALRNDDERRFVHLLVESQLR